MLALGILIGLGLAFVLAIYCKRRPDSAVAQVTERVTSAFVGGSGPREK